jgi:predicted amidohydrolase YtcJ
MARILAASGPALALAQGAPRTADLILHHARIYTVDRANTIAEAVAVQGDRILQVGSEADVLRLRGSSTRVIDLGGATMLPGLHDAHGHFTGLGEFLRTLNLRGTTSYQQIVDLVRQRVATAKPGEWILGRAWDQNDWADTQFPTHDQLSAVSPANPVYLTRVDGHAGLANRAAMSLAGLTAATVDPPGGRIIRDSRNEPTGVLIDNAQRLVSSHIPADNPQRLDEAILLADRELRRVGITTVHDAGTDGRTVDAYKRLIDAGQLKTRLYVMVRGSLASLQPFFAKGPVVDYAHHRMAVRAIKIVADGCAWIARRRVARAVHRRTGIARPAHDAARGDLRADAGRLEGRFPDGGACDRRSRESPRAGYVRARSARGALVRARFACASSTRRFSTHRRSHASRRSV